jgi:hypothetical protein
MRNTYKTIVLILFSKNNLANGFYFIQQKDAPQKSIN